MPKNADFIIPVFFATHYQGFFKLSFHINYNPIEIHLNYIVHQNSYTLLSTNHQISTPFGQKMVSDVVTL